MPTDTVLVLDLSGSMEGSESALINAANSAIDTLLKNNENNRVGVVLYSASNQTGSSTYAESVTRILPIDRYTTGSDGKYLNLSNNGRVSVDSDVSGTVAGADLNNRKSFGGGTYIQAGLWEAMKMFLEMDTEISDNNWQAGEDRMPILVLMSDGAPSTGTSYFADVENSRYTSRNNTVYGSNVGNGNESGLTAGNAFLTQLTASYVMNRIEAHYKQENADVRSLFYTLGFNIGNNSAAQAVMNPGSTALTDSLWTTYNGLSSGTTMNISVKNRNGNTSDVAISKNTYATDKSYVDQYFSASGTGLSDAFKSIVDEILIQSRYYPTHLEGGSPDFSGYVVFEDIIGEYMEVKHINGILLGDTLYDGKMMASKFADTSSGGLGTVENPTALGDEFIASVKTRLGISSTAEAQALVANAFNAGQLKYNSDTDWSNYIGWYAKADGTYAGFWDESSSASAPKDALYKIKSYGFLGETAGSIKNSDMMYMTVQVRTNIETNEQRVIWKIPAALVPVITYLVTLDGTNINNATNVNVTVDDAGVSPIRLLFESGLRSDLNEFNITRITDSKHIGGDGVTRQFWTNYFDISAPTHDEHITAISYFTPSKENERFYYTFDSAVYKLVDGEYVLVPQNETLDPDGEYYHRRYIFKNDTADKKPIFFYEKMSKASIEAAEWKDDFEALTGEHVGAYVVPAGTPARELQMYDEQKSETDGIDTKSAHMVFHPYMTEQNGVVYVDMNLGNNGLLEVTAAQGIKLSKTIDIYEPNTSDSFSFRITLKNADGTAFTGSLLGYVTELDAVPYSQGEQVSFSNDGTYTLDLKSNQTFWLASVPTGTVYTIEEISDNADYKVKSVHVNGVSTGKTAEGTVAAYYIDDVDFVNTAIGEGDLVIAKQVIDENGNIVNINENVTFTMEVTLTDAENKAVSGRFEASNDAGYVEADANGKFTVTLGGGKSIVIRNIPEETNYSVVETSVPSGFTFNADKSVSEGVVDALANDIALIVNTYAPVGADGSGVSVEISKLISGNRTEWIENESYTFVLKRLNLTGTEGETVSSFTIKASDTLKKYVLDLSSENYSKAGIYHYSISEVAGIQGGVTYDSTEKRFAVVVNDADMDGDLEIIAVNNEIGTAVTKNGEGYKVEASFTNVYQPVTSDTVTIDILKKMNGDYRLNGFVFALYNKDPSGSEEATELVRSTVTNVSGQAHITLTYAPNLATAEGVKHTYYLAEIDTGNPNITYDDKVYVVEVTVKDNGDGTISAIPVITLNGTAAPTPEFTNTFVPSEKAYVTLTAEKIIEGERNLNANEFEFVIEALTDGAPLPINTSVKNSADGSVVFDAIEFDQAGVYKYKIYESKNNVIGGFTYDERFYEVTVTVTDSEAKLYAEVVRTVKESENESGRTLTDDETMSFTNVYDAEDTTVTISGTKILTGKTMREGEFSFILTPDDINNPMPQNSTVKNDAFGKIVFDFITFDKVGTYTYTLKEIATNDTRYTFDTSVYTVTIVVTDDSQGKLKSNVILMKNGMVSSEIVFRNSFTPTPITFDIYDSFGGEKVLDGRDVKDGEFEFKLINAASGEQIGQTVKNDVNGEFKFPETVIQKEGIYHYKITELVGDENGVTYDTSSYHVRLEVKRNGNGELEITDKKLYKATVVKEEAEGTLTEVTHYTETGKIIFNNTYKANGTTVTVNAQKILTGRPLEEGEFSFTLYDKDGKKIQTVKNGKDGSIVFDAVTVNEAGEYVYTVSEDAGEKGGVTYDKSVYKIEITVTDDFDGQLVADVKVNGKPIEKETGEVIKFLNTYTVEPNKINIQGIKNLTGRPLEEGEFSFTLYDKDGKELQTVKNGKDGSIVFDAITVNEAGEYVYTVSEDAGEKGGVTYDKSVYTVKAAVKDNGDGTFSVSYDISKDGKSAEKIVFENSYKAAPAAVKVEGNKILNGRELAEGEFSFTLYDKDGKALQTVKNGKDGSIVFDAITVNEAGEYVYTVREVIGSEEGVGYDKAEYKVTVKVTDNGDGTFTVSSSITKNGEKAEKIEFVNLYSEPVIDDNPQTSDNSHLWMWAALAVISGGMFVMNSTRRKKKLAHK